MRSSLRFLEKQKIENYKEEGKKQKIRIQINHKIVTFNENNMNENNI